MSLLLDALQRSEQRPPLTLAPTESVPAESVPPSPAPAASSTQEQPLSLAPGPSTAPPSAAPASASAPVRPAAAGSARQAAQTMVGATIPATAPVPQARVRRLVFSLLLGLVLAAVSWFGWQYWQSSQRSSLAVTPPTAQPLADGAALPAAADAAASADDMAPADAASAAVDGNGDAPGATAMPGVVGDAPTPGTPSAGERAAQAVPPVSPPKPRTPAAAKPLDAAQAASAKDALPAPRPPRPEPESAPARNAAARDADRVPAAAAEPATADTSAPSAATPTTPPAGGAATPGRAGKLPAAPQDARLVRSETQRRLQSAWTALGQNDAVRAQALYQQVLAERPDDPDATLGLAVALHRQRQLEPAWKAYQRSLHLWPENETARTGLLSILSESDPVTAESRLQEWVQTRPRDAAAQSALGNLLGRQGRWAEALGPLTQAQSLAPERAAHAYNLAVALDQSRRYEDALRMYRQALQIGGAGIPVKAIEYRLQDLQEQLSR
ncbi:MAG: tetratricopeptide repeat protein [Burkholderiaceae bacterium]|nr:tetratricopeptide repeat protein [Burkholderiaceae bacterium]